MRSNKYINTDPASNSHLSRVACSLLVPLILMSNKDNHVNKARFTKSVPWITDYRTWDRYWTELEENDVLVKIDKKTWMLSPYYCYADGESHSLLLTRWEQAHESIS